MEACGKAADAPKRPHCPGCGQAGREVEGITLKALLTPEALARLQPSGHCFCPTVGCPVVYFGGGGLFRREDVLVPVFQKEPEGDRTVCYCFAIREDQIRREILAGARSASAERIKALVQTGRCACEVRNPQGTCCLGNVLAVSRSVTPTSTPTPK